MDSRQIFLEALNNSHAWYPRSQVVISQQRQFIPLHFWYFGGVASILDRSRFSLFCVSSCRSATCYYLHEFCGELWRVNNEYIKQYTFVKFEIRHRCGTQDYTPLVKVSFIRQFVCNLKRGFSNGVIFKTLFPEILKIRKYFSNARAL